MYLFFDTETTGVPRNYKAPVSDVGNWPRLVQLGYIVMQDKETILETEFIISPNGFEIPEAASKVHGITTERAREVGQPLSEVLDNFAFWVKNSDLIIGHNIDFDVRVVGAEFYRLLHDDPFKGKTVADTMIWGTNFCQLPGPYGHYKWPKLHELYFKLFGEEMGAAHTALQDIQNTARCYFALMERGVITT